MIRHKFLFYAALILFILIGLKVSFRTVAAVTPVCGACHETQAQYVAWKKSAHAGVPCLDCHSKPGLGGYVGAPFRALSSLGVKLTGGKRTVVVYTDDDVCLRCHDKILDDLVVKDGLKMKHRQIIDDARRCGDCHAGVGHNVAGGASYNRFASMDKCLGCHNTKRLQKCDLCHSKKTGSGLSEPAKMGLLAHDSGWGRRHGSANTRDCRLCHDKKFCAECHETEMPHPSKWPLVHGRAALAESGCDACHRGKFCDACHVLPMPHERDWEHGTPARKQRGLCDRCHAEKSCDDCHDLHDTHKLKKP